MNEIQFFCVICGEGLSVRAASAGGFCECPRCMRVVPIPGFPAQPGQPATPGAAFPQDILEIEMKFICQCCGNKIRVDVRLQGQMLECPVCHAQTKAPPWAGQFPPADDRGASARTTRPVARLSHEECEFLSAPVGDRGAPLAPAGAP